MKSHPPERKPLCLAAGTLSSPARVWRSWDTCVLASPLCSVAPLLWLGHRRIQATSTEEGEAERNTIGGWRQGWGAPQMRVGKSRMEWNLLRPGGGPGSAGFKRKQEVCMGPAARYWGAVPSPSGLQPSSKPHCPAPPTDPSVTPKEAPGQLDIPSQGQVLVPLRSVHSASAAMSPGALRGL